VSSILDAAAVGYLDPLLGWRGVLPPDAEPLLGPVSVPTAPVALGVVDPSTVLMPAPAVPDPLLGSRGVLPPAAEPPEPVSAPTAPVALGVVDPSTLPLPAPAVPGLLSGSRGELPPAAELLEPVPAPVVPVLGACALTETAAAARNNAAAAPTMTCLANDRCDGTAFMATP
jgi:hypothetical protein